MCYTINTSLVLLKDGFEFTSNFCLIFHCHTPHGNNVTKWKLEVHGTLQKLQNLNSKNCELVDKLLVIIPCTMDTVWILTCGGKKCFVHLVLRVAKDDYLKFATL